MKYLRFKKLGLNQAEPTGLISLAEIEQMPIQDYLELDGRLLYVRRRTRFDTAVIDANYALPAGAEKELFRKGKGEEDQTFNGVEFVKNGAHCNVPRKGEFSQGTINIVKALLVDVPFFASKPTTMAAGIITNAKGTAPAANYDPAIAAYALLNNMEVTLQIADEERPVSGRLIDFANPHQLAGLAGAAVGGIFQNSAIGRQLDNPQVIEGGLDFFVKLEALAAYDNTTATGVDRETAIRVSLATTEVIPERP